MKEIGTAYVQATSQAFSGELYYSSGELKYKGGCVHPDGYGVMPCGVGTEYYKSGTIKKQGLFQRRGLVCGRMFYPSGKLRFEGYFQEPSGYGPAYPTHGSFYAEDGTLIYQGQFQCKFGGVGYPMVVKPESFGAIEMRE